MQNSYKICVFIYIQKKERKKEMCACIFLLGFKASSSSIF